jgi:hypothetical protein
LRLVLVLVVALLAAAGAAVAVLLATETEDRTVTATATVTETVERTVTAEAALLPAEVEETRAAVQAAAEARDYDALAELVPATGFNYSFGGELPGGAVAYWQDLEAKGEDPLGDLAKVLELPYSLYAGSYVWPFAYNLAPNELTAYERGLLGDLADDYAGESYLGWRAGINPDGHWSFFVRGD